MFRLSSSFSVLKRKLSIIQLWTIQIFYLLTCKQSRYKHHLSPRDISLSPSSQDKREEQGGTFLLDFSSRKSKSIKTCRRKIGGSYEVFNYYIFFFTLWIFYLLLISELDLVVSHNVSSWILKISLLRIEGTSGWSQRQPKLKSKKVWSKYATDTANYWVLWTCFAD